MSKGQPISASSPYALVSTRPLHVLIFLAPLIVLYELGSVRFLAGRGADTIGARGLLGSIFQAVGAAGLHLPPLTLLVVLLAWHIMLRDPWSLRWRVVLGMAVESALWAIPLLVLGLALSLGPAAALGGAGVQSTLAGLSWQARLTVAVGAGLYEELLFRLVLITALHVALVDLLGLRPKAGNVLAALGSAVAFALYHNVTLSDPSQTRLVLFYALAGLYFAGMFITRGFGVVVAAHAIYDVFALLAFPAAREG